MTEKLNPTQKFLISVLACMVYTAGYILVSYSPLYAHLGIFLMLPCIFDSLKGLVDVTAMRDVKYRLLNIATLFLSFFAIMLCALSVLEINSDANVILVLLGVYPMRLLVETILCYREMVRREKRVPADCLLQPEPEVKIDKVPEEGRDELLETEETMSEAIAEEVLGEKVPEEKLD